MLPDTVQALIAQYDVVLVVVDNAKRPLLSISEQEQMVPLQRLNRKRSNKSKQRVLPNRWSSVTSPVPSAFLKQRFLLPSSPLSPDSFPSDLPSSSFLSPSIPVRRSSFQSGSMKEFIAVIDIITEPKELKPLRRRGVRHSSSHDNKDSPMSRPKRRDSINATMSDPVHLSLRMPVRRRSIKKSSFRRNTSCNSYFDNNDEKSSHPEPNSQFQAEELVVAAAAISTEPDASPKRVLCGFETFRKVLTTTTTRPVKHRSSRLHKPSHKNDSAHHFELNAVVEQQKQTKKPTTDAASSSVGTIVLKTQESFAASDSSSEKEEFTRKEGFIPSSSDSSTEEEERITKGAGSSSDDEEVHGTCLDKEEGYDLNSNNTRNDDNEEEEYRKYYHDEKQQEDITASTVENESVSVCERPDVSTKPTNNNVLQRAWKRLSLNHHSHLQDDLVSNAHHPKQEVSPRRGSLNHMLYTQWKSSQVYSNPVSSPSIAASSRQYRNNNRPSPTSLLQRIPSMHHRSRRRWSMTNSTSTTTSTTRTTVDSTASAEPTTSELIANNAKWWKQTRRSSLTTRRYSSSPQQQQQQV